VAPSDGLAAVACYVAAADGPSVVYGRYDVRAGTIILQYWYFYDANFWSLQYPPSAFAWQAHEGDWEVVSVVLDSELNPVEAGYSQHCTGEKRSWANVQKVGTHPLVYVATGSHANLFAPGLHPISLSCYPPQIQAILQQNHVTPFDFLLVPGRTLGLDCDRAGPRERTALASLPGDVGRGPVHPHPAADRTRHHPVRHVTGRPVVPRQLGRPAWDDRRLRSGLRNASPAPS
jgi:hypothetical protein